MLDFYCSATSASSVQTGAQDVRDQVVRNSVSCRSVIGLERESRAAAAAPISQHDVFRDEQWARQGRGLGGLEGADRHCQTLAQAAGAGGKTWRAYLSTQAADGAQAVNARDRIGSGPWQNFKGEAVAQSVDELHGDNNKLGMPISLTERGTMVAGVGYTPNYHDVLTGSQPDGRAFAGGEDRTCRNWTSSTQGAAMLGHIDRKGLRDDAASKSWNSSHPSRGSDGGCSQNDLRGTGGNGLFYCFAAN